MTEEFDREKQHQEDLQRIRGFRLMDDDFMNACFDNNIECTELVLRIIMSKSDLKVKWVQTQKIMKNLQGRSIWLDINAEDSENTKYDIEVQRADKGASAKRARYHSSLMDANILDAGEDFENLPETYVIFITEHDVIGKNKPLYEINRYINGTDELFNDGSHIYYVNGAMEDSTTELGKLMHDFQCTNPDDMYYKTLADRARYFKEDEKGVAVMCKAMEDMRNETARITAKEIARKLLVLGTVTAEQVADTTGLSVEEVLELQTTQTA